MKKIVMISIAMMVLIATVGAWSIGTSLTPTEFANKDIDSHDFNPVPKGNSIIGTGSGALFRTTAEIETFTKTGTEYKETNKEIFGQYGTREYVDCRSSGSSKTDCITQVKKTIVSRIKSSIITEKTMLKAEQEEARLFALYANELQTGDVTITANDIETTINVIKQKRRD